MTRGKPDVSILIVSYNSQRFLPRCLAAVENASSGLNCEVLFMENGDRGSEALVEALCPSARIVAGRGNIGFAAANNLLAKQASGRWLLLLNPDAEIEPDAIAALLEAAAANRDFGILGGMTVIDRETGASLPPLEPPGFRMAIKSMFGVLGRKWPQYSARRVIPVQAASGGFLLVEHGIWERLSGLDERFFLYAEDLDLCIRARRQGVKVGMVPEARAHHAIGSGASYAPQRQTYQMLGNATYVRKHFARPIAPLVLLLLWLSICVRAFGAMILGIGMSRYRQMFRGLAPLALRPHRWFWGYPSSTE